MPAQYPMVGSSGYPTGSAGMCVCELPTAQRTLPMSSQIPLSTIQMPQIRKVGSDMALRRLVRSIERSKIASRQTFMENCQQNPCTVPPSSSVCLSGMIGWWTICGASRLHRPKRCLHGGLEMGERLHEVGSVPIFHCPRRVFTRVYCRTEMSG